MRSKSIPWLPPVNVMYLSREGWGGQVKAGHLNLVEFFFCPKSVCGWSKESVSVFENLSKRTLKRSKCRRYGQLQTDYCQNPPPMPGLLLPRLPSGLTIDRCIRIPS